MPQTRLSAAVGVPREEVTVSPITYEDMRPGCFDPVERLKRHGRELGRGVALVPVVPALLRPDVHGGQGPRPRRPVRQGVQRLDVRRLVRRLRWTAHPASDHPAVGRRARGRRGTSQRGPWRARGVLHRDPAVPRAPERAHRLLGPVLPGVRRDRDRRVDAHRVELEDAVDVGRRAGRRRLHAHLHERGDVTRRLPDVGCARALPAARARVLRRSDRLDPVRARARRRGVAREPRAGVASPTR